MICLLGSNAQLVCGFSFFGTSINGTRGCVLAVLAYVLFMYTNVQELVHRPVLVTKSERIFFCGSAVLCDNRMYFTLVEFADGTRPQRPQN